MIKTILITGGAGFIGSAVIRYILEMTSDRVVNVDKLTYASHPSALDSVKENPRYVFEQVDITDAEKIEQIFTQYQPDCVLHLAAESHVDRSIAGAAAFIQTNIVGTYVLLEAARHYWTHLPKYQQSTFRFHHVSTDEVFGDLAHATPAFTEQSPYHPSNPYSASKASSDHFVRAWYRTYGLPILVTHSANNYGYYQYPEKLIPFMLSQALQGKPLTLYGDGQQSRDWLFVDDHARALYLVLTQGRVGETYNISGNGERTNLSVVTEMCDLLNQLKCSGRLAPFEHQLKSVEDFKQLITFVADRPGHDVRYAMSGEKIQNELGWLPETDFSSGLTRTVMWYLNDFARQA